MSTMKKPANAQFEERRFPPEAYEYRDDVSPEAVEKIRRKAAPYLEKADLKLIDGRGRYSA